MKGSTSVGIEFEKSLTDEGKELMFYVCETIREHLSKYDTLSFTDGVRLMSALVSDIGKNGEPRPSEEEKDVVLQTGMALAHSIPELRSEAIRLFSIVVLNALYEEEPTIRLSLRYGANVARVSHDFIAGRIAPYLCSEGASYVFETYVDLMQKSSANRLFDESTKESSNGDRQVKA